MSDLDDLKKIVRGAIPKEWDLTAGPVGEGSFGYVFEWSEDGERIGGMVLEVYPHVVSFLGLDVGEAGAGVFRNLCRVLPGWARSKKGIGTLMVPFAQSEHMRSLLADAGFENTGAAVWEANIAESDAVDEYGKA